MARSFSVEHLARGRRLMRRAWGIVVSHAPANTAKRPSIDVDSWRWKGAVRKERTQRLCIGRAEDWTLSWDVPKFVAALDAFELRAGR
jgi:hypothetical protein